MTGVAVWDGASLDDDGRLQGSARDPDVGDNDRDGISLPARQAGEGNAESLSEICIENDKLTQNNDGQK